MADTALSSAALKLLFETGDIPTQQNFADAWTSYENIVDGNLLIGTDVAITAHAGGGQGSAYQITKKGNQLTTVATAGDSVKLPAALAGRSGYILNTQTAAADVFPASGEAFINGTTNTATSLPGGYTLFFYCLFDGQWLIYYLSDTGQSTNLTRTTADVGVLAIYMSLANTYEVSALAQNMTINAPTFKFGTGQDLTIIIKDNGTSRTLTWNAVYVAGAGSLPTATIVGKQMVMIFKYVSTTNKWYCVSTSVEGYATAPVRVYWAHLSQTGTAAPVATVMQNTTGATISWSRLAQGIYTLTSTGLFVSGTYIPTVITASGSPDAVGLCWSDNTGDEPDEVYMNNKDDSFSFVDGWRGWIMIIFKP